MGTRYGVMAPKGPLGGGGVVEVTGRGSVWCHGALSRSHCNLSLGERLLGEGGYNVKGPYQDHTTFSSRERGYWEREGTISCIKITLSSLMEGEVTWRGRVQYHGACIEITLSSLMEGEVNWRGRVQYHGACIAITLSSLMEGEVTCMVQFVLRAHNALSGGGRD